MVYGWESEWFLRYNTFYEMKGVGPAPGVPPWDPQSMSLNAPHHKEQEYIWCIGRGGGGSEWFPRYYAFYEKSGWGMPPGHPGIHVAKCGLS